MNSWVLKHDLIECFLAQTFPVLAYSHSPPMQFTSELHPRKASNQNPINTRNYHKTRQDITRLTPAPCPTFGDIPSLFLSGPAWHGVLLRGRDEAGSGGQDSQDTALGGGRWRVVGLWRVEIELEKWGEILWIIGYLSRNQMKRYLSRDGYPFFSWNELYWKG